MKKPSPLSQGKPPSSSAPVRQKQPAAPAVYRPQAPPRVLQKKAAPGQHAQQKPATPPVYRPSPAPKVLQPKTPASNRPADQCGRAPVAPPVYRPQPAPRVLQRKQAAARQPPAIKPPSHPAAPPARLPEVRNVAQHFHGRGGRSFCIQRMEDNNNAATGVEEQEDSWGHPHLEEKGAQDALDWLYTKLVSDPVIRDLQKATRKWRDVGRTVMPEPGSDLYEYLSSIKADIVRNFQTFERYKGSLTQGDLVKIGMVAARLIHLVNIVIEQANKGNLNVELQGRDYMGEDFVSPLVAKARALLPLAQTASAWTNKHIGDLTRT